jgi:hypothetical protein
MMAGYHSFEITFGSGFLEIQEPNRVNPYKGIKELLVLGFFKKMNLFPPSQNPSTIYGLA